MRSPVLVVLVVLLVACGGEESAPHATPEDRLDASVVDMAPTPEAPDPDAAPEPDAGSEPDGELSAPDAEAVPEPPEMQALFAEFIGPACGNVYCHGVAQETVHDQVGSGACDGQPWIVPGDPESSLLWRKIAPGVEVCGTKMPPGRPGLSPEAADRVRAWIAAGAPR